MNEIEALSRKQFDEFLNQIDIEMSLLNLNDSVKIIDFQNKIEMVYSNINNKIEKGINISFVEKKFFYDKTKKEEKILLDFELFKDFIYQDIYHIYLTDINQEIKEMAEVHSGGISIRNLLGINLNPLAIKNTLNKIIIEFQVEILNNDKLNKKNYELKTAIKKEYKEFVNEIINESIDVENKIFEIALFSKMIYLKLFEMDLKKEIIKFNNDYFELNIGFYVHISFRHYYQIIKSTKLFLEKNHFFVNECNEWKDILFKLGSVFTKTNSNLENTSVLYFRLGIVYYKLVFNKKSKKLTSLFPLNKDMISKIDKDKMIIL